MSQSPQSSGVYLVVHLLLQPIPPPDHRPLMLWQAVHSPVKCFPLSDALQGFLRSGVRYHVLQVQEISLPVRKGRLQADR